MWGWKKRAITAESGLERQRESIAAQDARIAKLEGMLAQAVNQPPQADSKLVEVLGPILAIIPQSYELMGRMATTVGDVSRTRVSAELGRRGGKQRAKNHAAKQAVGEIEAKIGDMVRACSECYQQSQGIPFNQRSGSEEVFAMHKMGGHEDQLADLLKDWKKAAAVGGAANGAVARPASDG